MNRTTERKPAAGRARSRRCKGRRTRRQNRASSGFRGRDRKTPAREPPARSPRTGWTAITDRPAIDRGAGSRAAIEISGDPYRLDLPPAWIPAARERGIRFVISSDAHAISDLDNVEYGVAMARRGGVRRAEVLNALGVAEFRAAVRPCC